MKNPLLEPRPTDLDDVMSWLDAKWSSDTSKVAFTGGFLICLAVVVHFTASDITHRLVPLEGEEFWGTTAGLGHAVAFAMIVASVVIAAGAFWRVNLVSKMSLLWGLVQVWGFLRASDYSSQKLAEDILLSTLFATSAECIAWLWSVRRSDAEPLYHLQRLSRIVGAVCAAVVLLWMVIAR